MNQDNPSVDKNQMYTLKTRDGETKIPCVTRNMRNFNTQLCSAGSSSSREALVLLPESKTLQTKYTALKGKLDQLKNPDILGLLTAISEYTQSLLPKAEANFGNLANNEISLGAVVRQGKGVCRHHSLLNCYFLSRLKEEGRLAGEIIHHRQEVDLRLESESRGAHTWALLKTPEGSVYGLDSGNKLCQKVGIVNAPVRFWGASCAESIFKNLFRTSPARN